MKESEERKREPYMLDFIVKYWLEVAFGLVCGAIAWLAKKYIAMSKTEKENHEAAILTTI
jgi:hypothetical protein